MESYLNPVVVPRSASHHRFLANWAGCAQCRCYDFVIPVLRRASYPASAFSDCICSLHPDNCPAIDPVPFFDSNYSVKFSMNLRTRRMPIFALHRLLAHCPWTVKMSVFSVYMVLHVTVIDYSIICLSRGWTISMLVCCVQTDLRLSPITDHGNRYLVVMLTRSFSSTEIGE